MGSPRLIYWARLGNLKAQVGSNLSAVVSADFTKTSKFGVGAYSDDPDKKLYLTPPSWTTAQGCIEFWMRPDWSLSDGVPSDSSTHRWISSWGTNNALQLGISYPGGVIVVMGTGGGGYTIFYGTTGCDMTAGADHHVGLSWRTTGVSGSKTVVLYIDNIEVASTTADIGSPPAWDTTYLLDDIEGASWQPDMVMAGFKMWDAPKTDFSDSLRERAGARDLLAAA